MKMPEYYSAIDSNRFLIKTARINEYNEEISPSINFLKRSGFKLVISRINAERIEVINDLLACGFKIMDVGLVYSHNLTNMNAFLSQSIDNIVKIRFFKIQDLNELIELTLESFEGYGHYFADKKLKREHCRETYADWIKNSCTNPAFGDTVFVAEIGGVIAGYLVVKLIENDRNIIVDTGLGAVKSKYRQDGVFRKLILETMIWAKQNNANEETVTVLSTNYSVNRSYSRMGYVIKQSFITLHGWL